MGQISKGLVSSNYSYLPESKATFLENTSESLSCVGTISKCCELELRNCCQLLGGLHT